MRAIIEGVEGGKLGLFKGGDRTLKIHLIEDQGEVIDLTDGAVSFDFYDTKDRRNAPVKTQAGVLTDPLAGYVTLVLLAAGMTFGPSVNDVPYYLFAKITAAGGDETVSAIPTEVTIK